MKNDILLSAIAGSELRSRSTMQLIKRVWKNDAENVFDFTGIDFISRSFADELYSFSKENNVQYINMQSIVKKMYDIVAKGREHKRYRTTSHTEILNIPTIQEFSSYTSSF